jgi:hypothetical protein
MIKPYRAALLAGLVWAFGAHSAAAETYRCKEGGKVVFSDRVCGTDAEVINVKPASGDKATAAPQNAYQSDEADYGKRYKMRKVARSGRGAPSAR